MDFIRVLLLNVFILIELNVLAQNPIANYKFDNEAADVSGNNNNVFLGRVSSSDVRF